MLNLETLDAAWVAVPDNQALVDRVRRAREEMLHADKMYDMVLAAYRESAVNKVVQKLLAMQRVVDLKALHERDQLDVLCRIAETLNIPAELRAGVLTEAINVVLRM